MYINGHTHTCTHMYTVPEYKYENKWMYLFAHLYVCVYSEISLILRPIDSVEIKKISFHAVSLT